jgi:hypothetical protein
MTNKQLAKLLRETGNLLFDKTYDPNEKLLLDEVADRLENQNKWISVEDRLPTWQDGKVLVFTKYGFSICERTVNSRWQGKHANWITHWMPLPELPTEKEN